MRGTFSQISKEAAFVLAAAVALAGCSARPASGLNGQVTNYTTCILPQDQGMGSLQGRWGGLPIPIVFDRDFYATNNASVMPAFRAAVSSWNAWASVKGATGFTIMDDGSDSSAGMDIPQITDCSQAAYTASLTTMVGIWKISTDGYHANVRSTCTGAGRLLAFDPTTNAGVQGQTDWITSNGNITGASILLNFEGFNAPGRVVVDAQSLLLHELGHVLGLLHSCNGSTATSTDATSAPNCANANSDYLQAVMFPYLQANQLRRSLTQNDIGRVNCLY